MKKVFTIILASALAFTFSSCQKSEIEKPVEGVPMTLTASIDVPQADTKTAVVYDDVNKVLKTSWVAGDKVSVFTLDANEVPMSHDIFTAASVSGHTADFTGTFTGGKGYSKIIVQYPALTSNTTDEYVFSGDYAYYIVENKTVFSHYNFYRGLGKDITSLDGDLSGFEEYDAMKGEGTISSNGKLEVTLKKMISVIRLEIDGANIPGGAKIQSVILNSNLKCFHISDWAYTKKMSFQGGNSQLNISRSINKTINTSKKFVVYIPNAYISELKDRVINIEVITTAGNYKSAEKTMGASHVLEPGYIYNFKAKVN